MRDAEAVRRFLRAEHRDLLAVALLLTGDRAAADALVERATLRALRRRHAGGLSTVDVRDEMARQSASGRVPGPGQVVDAGLLDETDDDLAPLATALADLTPPVRTVAVLRLAEDLPVADTARILGRTAAEVGALERDALTRLLPVAGGADRLSGRLDALAAVPPDDGAADRAADSVLARRRHRRGAAVLVAAAVLTAPPLTVAAVDRPAPPGQSAEAPDRGPVVVLAGPPRGSLVDDEAFLKAARRVPWGTDDDPHVHSRRVVFATDTPAGPVALVVADTDGGLEGAWLTGPPGTAGDALAPWLPERIGRTRPAAVLVEAADAAAVVVVAAPGDAVEFSSRLHADASGAVGRQWTAAPGSRGTAVIEVADATAGRAAAVRVVRDGEVVHQTGVSGPAGRTASAAEPLDLAPLRPGTARADPALVAETADRLARPLGVDRRMLVPRLLWSAELSRTGGLGRVVVVTARAPGGGRVVAAHGRLGTVRGGLPVPCGTSTVPADVGPARLSAATVCSVSDGSGDDADRTWLVVTAPPAAVEAEVVDAGGAVLDVLDLAGGGSMTRTPDGAAQVRLRDADGRPLDVVPVAFPEQPFGDYGDG